MVKFKFCFNPHLKRWLYQSFQDNKSPAPPAPFPHPITYCGAIVTPKTRRFFQFQKRGKRNLIEEHLRHIKVTFFARIQ